MAKTESRPVPQRSTKPSKALKPKATAPKVSKLSAQYVADSDDEDAPPEDRSVKKATVAEAQSISKSKIKAKTQEAPAAPKSPSEESESSDDDDASPPRPTVPQSQGVGSPKVNGVKRKADEASSSEESEESEESEDELPDAPAAKRAKTKSSTEEEESSEDEAAEPEVPSVAAAPTNSHTSAQHANSTEPIPASPFEAPAGYVAVNIQQAGFSTDYSSASLAGKQIWHITAPSDVPLSSISEVVLDAIQTAKPVLSYKGIEYVLNEDATGDEHESILLPSKDGYAATQQRVQKKLHLQQKITLPNLTARQASQVTGSAAAADIAQAAVSRVRPQPKGLRMRYKPPGFGPGELGAVGSDSESVDEDTRPAAVATFQFPRALGGQGAAASQKQGGTGNARDAEQRPKKKRKDKQDDPLAGTKITTEDAGMARADAEVSHETGIMTNTSLTPAMKIVMPEVVEHADVPMTGGLPEPSSKEEKAKRKEEKRQKKEAKRKAKEVAA